MDNFISIGPQGTIHILGIKLVGFNSENLGKILITAFFILTVLFLASVARHATQHFLSRHRSGARMAFWTRQGINVFSFLALIIGIASIWFDDPTRLTTAMGLITAGLAFALQKVISSIAGYLVILRGKTFNVGDRIVMGGVRGDVIALGFMQTTIMEMGQPPSVQTAEPAIWVKSRQFTGRIVSVPNSKIFDEPIYNYSRDFEFIWEELILPVAYRDDHVLVEKILLHAAQAQQEMIHPMLMQESRKLCRQFDVLRIEELNPKVFYRFTDNWLELTVRFITRTYGVREVKDEMTRKILCELEKAGIGIASATFAVVSVPPLQVQVQKNGAK